MAVEMKKINFQDFQEPSVGAENLNQMQRNIEEAINEGAGSGDGILTGSVIGYNGDTIPEGYEEVDAPNAYSTTEQVVGTWNGKPLYRRVIEFGNFPNNNINIYDTNIDSNTTVLRRAECYGKASDLLVPIPYFSTTTGVSFNMTITKTNNWGVVIVTISDRSTWTGYVILEYTKTTD